MTATSTTPLQLCIVAGRRPDLLKATLESFQARVFCNFEITSVHVNIDPIFGDQDALRECEALVYDNFPQARIHTPVQPSFGAAVRRLWLAFEDELAFHLEDDWVVEEPIFPSDILEKLGDKVAAVAPVSREHHWNRRSRYLIFKERIRLGGVKVWTKRSYGMGTSPKFILGEVARRFAELMDPRLDPEKQMDPQINRPLFEEIQTNRCVYLRGKHGPFLIRDIGRQWREEQGIHKILLPDGRTDWASN